MRTWSIPLGSFFGVHVRLHLAYLLLAFFVLTQTGAAKMPLSRGWALMGIMLLAVALHEVGHAIAAAFAGARLKLILLMPLGGVSAYAGSKGSEEERRFLNPRQETVIAIAGPVTSFLVAGFGAALIKAVAPTVWLTNAPLISSGALVKSVVWINIVLGAINLIPAYPLDFGRILRVQFARVRPALDATRAAVGLSQAISLVLTIVGLFQNNLWVMLAGFFVFLGAQIEDRSLSFQSVVENVRMEEVMLTDYSVLSPADTLEDALQKAIHSLQDDFPVVRSGDLVGVITRQRIVEALHSGGNGYVQSAMTKAFEVAQRNETLSSAFRKLSTRGLTLIPVVEGEQLIGIVTLQNLMHSIAMLAERRRREKAKF